jgi:hypothetical protein
MDLKEEEVLGDFVGQHWYYRSKAAALLQLTSHLQARHILDVGAGSGFFSRKLLTSTVASEAMCVDPFYAEDREESVVGKPLQFRRSCESTDADLLLMMDVLEHVEDDLGLLNSYVGLLPTGAHVLVTVPAFKFLWSGHDEFLGHYRRYTLKQMVELLEGAGLKLEQRCYYFGLVFPLAATIRLLGSLGGKRAGAPQSDLRRHGAFTNGLLSLTCRMELPWFRFNRLAGLSVFCLARKS